MINKTKFILIILSALTICIFTSCASDNKRESINLNELSNINQPLSSSSSNYEAIIEKFDDNGVGSFKLFIVDVNDKESKYEVDLVFRTRDRNYVFWADTEDVLWSYSGDVGTFFWTKEDGSWVKKAYANYKDAIVPKALKEARPNKY